MNDITPHPASAKASAAPPLVRTLFRIAGSLMPETVGGFLAGRMLRPRRRKPHNYSDRLRGATSLKINAECGMVNASLWGKGARTMLLMHGWEGDRSDFSELAPALVEAGFAVVAVEAPAHGDSALRDTDVHAMAEALSAVADHIGPVYGVIAHSLGAAAAVQLLSGGRHMAARLVLLAPGGELACEVRRLGQTLALSDRCVAALNARLEQHYGMPVDMCSTSRLARMLQVPALVIHDRDDQVVPFLEGSQVARSLPGARFFATEGLGHRRLLRDPGVIAATVDFCAERSAVRAA